MRREIRQWTEIISNPGLAKSFCQIDLCMDGHSLSYKDKYRVYDAYVSQLIVTYDVAQALDHYLELEGRNAGYVRDFSIANLNHTLIEWSRVDVLSFVENMKAMLLAIRHISSWRCRNYPSFNTWLSAFGIQRSHPVVRPYVRLLRDVWNTLDSTVFAYANTVFQYSARLTLKDVDWIEEDEINSYIEFENVLHNQSYPADLVGEVRHVIKWWLRDFTCEGAQGVHGYGATAGVKRSAGTAAKYFDFVPTHESAILAAELGWWPENYFWPHLSEAHALYLSLTREEHEALGLPFKRDLHMKYNLVPKAFNKKRGVSQEPTSQMFMQKMIFGLLDDYFMSHPECHIHLHDQEINRRMCIEGSRNHKFATIDLSSASDSVTNTLVKEIFQDNILGDLLQLSRSEIADVSCKSTGTVTEVPLEKFAPMGSATCFPIECLVFSAVVTVAQQHLGIDDNYAVYGDDIVCSTRSYDHVVELLTKLNFKVNLDKSYGNGSDFTESCGMEAFKGQDVSPLRISRKWDACAFLPNNRKTARGHKAPDKSTALSAAYDAANEALAYGFMTLRYYRIQQCMRKYPLAFFSYNEKIGFLNVGTRGYDERRIRYNEELHRVEILGTSIESRTALGPDLLRWSKLCEEYAYTKRSSLLYPEDRIECKCGSASTYVRTRWIPADDLDLF